MGAHLLCLESITHNFQFGPKGFEHLLPSMVLVLPFSSKKISRIWPTMKFCPTSSPPLWSNAPCHHTITTSLWLHKKFHIQTILKTPQNFEVSCIVGNCIVIPNTYFPWPVYTSPS
jgi:hypothetical protein